MLPKSKRVSYKRDLKKARLSGIVGWTFLIGWFLLSRITNAHPADLTSGKEDPWYPFAVYYLTLTNEGGSGDAHTRGSIVKKSGGVNPKLKLLVEEAIRKSPIDFRVTEGLRTLSRQRHLVSIGASQTLDSKHLVGDAVDLVPWDGGPRWEWPLIYRLAEHIRSVALIHSISLRWGAIWDVNSFTYTTKPPEELVNAYVARMKSRGKKAFLDGPHFELCQRSVKG